MADAPARQGGRREEISMNEATAHLLDECRMVLPGIQTLFGFQLIAVFAGPFLERLAQWEQELHLLAAVLVAIAIALVMAPAAVHRQAHLRSIDERFLRVSSRLLLASMYPLAVAICLELYLVAQMVTGSRATSAALAAALLVVFAGMWLALPRRERRFQ